MRRHPASSKKGHLVILSRPYDIGVYPVTREEWTVLMGNNPSAKKDIKFPVEMVSWYEAVRFCNYLSIVLGLVPVYSLDDPHHPLATNGIRLPTEAEWEFAATAEGTLREVSQMQLWSMGWFQANSLGHIHPVGKKIPNYLGLYDMFGNVNEWTQDWAGSFANSGGTLTPGGRWDPTGSPTGTSKVRRGGAFNTRHFYGGVDGRLPYDPHERIDNTGFRLARSVFSAP